MASRERLERIHRVRTLQLGMVRAEESAAHERFASEAALRNRIASLAESIAPAPEEAAGFSFAAAAHYRERLHISAQAAEGRLANAVARVEAAGEKTREAKRDQSAIEKLLARDAAEALAAIRKLEATPSRGGFGTILADYRAMTNNTISPTLTLATLPLGGAPALATPPSGDLAIPPDFALALAELAAAPAEGMPRLPLAAPGKPLPVKLADAAAMPLADTLLDELPALPESGDPQPALAKYEDAADDDATRDPGLDPALSWLIAAPVAVPAQVAPDPVETVAVIVKKPAIAPTPTESDAKPAVVEVATAQAPAAMTTDTPDRMPLAVEPRATPQPVATKAAAIPDQLVPAPLPAPTGAIEALAAESAITKPDRPAATVRAALEIDPKLAKVIADAPVVPVARPLPVAPPRFIETRITPTIVAAPVTVATPVTIPAPVEPTVADVPTAVPFALPEKVAAPVREKAPETLALAPTAQPVAPAPQLAAPALAAVGAAAPRPLPRPIELRPLAETGASLFAAALTHAATAPTAVQPTADTQSPGMDLTRDSGLERMIDRIEMLRDDADARDTRIRLVPDALGPVEVSVRRDGDAVRVHFTADQPATRALIADAQPRLTELAEARGIRISQASVDTGTASDGRARPQPQQTAQLPAAPRRARTETTDSGDERIA